MVHNEILATPSLPAGQGVWTFYGEVTIAAPAKEVYEAVRDFQSYPEWNQYTTNIDTPSGTNDISIGDAITLHYRPEPSGKTMEVPCKIVSISESVEDVSICWRGAWAGLPTWMLLPEKVQTVMPKGENECVFKIWETQAGPLAHVIRWTMGAKLSAMNQGIADGLKSYVEGKRGVA